MSRPRKPTKELELNGAFTKDPQRREARKYEPPSNGPIGDPPVYFDDNRRDLWHEVVDLVPPTVLTKADRIVVEVIVRKLEELRNGSITGTGVNTLVASLSRLGLTPADRSRVGIAPEKDDEGNEDDFATFLKQNPGHTRAN